MSKASGEEKPDVIARAAEHYGMTRAAFVSMCSGVGDESLEVRARRIVREGGSFAGMLDRGITDPPREPRMDARGRWKFPR